MAILDDVKAYLASVGVPTGRYSDSVLNQVIAVEQANQTKKLRSGTSAELPVVEALCRRVQVTLAKRGLPLGVIETSGDGDGGRVFMPTLDPEIRRLEAPFRKLVVG